MHAYTWMVARASRVAEVNEILGTIDQKEVRPSTYLVAAVVCVCAWVCVCVCAEGVTQTGTSSPQSPHAYSIL